MRRTRSRIFPVVIGAVAAYLIFIVVTIMLWEPSEKGPDDLDWDDREKYNLQQIAKLTPGISVDEVIAQLGSPNFNEAYTHNDGDMVQILRYRTHRTKGDGQTTTDETTPLLFRNGVLSSWGEAALQRALLVPTPAKLP
ncbi:DUF3192 domain-containing protein [Ferrimonas lipolytica]|uniref:DUF3192 domain-containing protein n=1 Tax=Ferrimonas lipolytica TaxID=2724191 RepID=A0A6H1UD66_9GAMM|nr:DUF3192 domain-containing protein [Ferrimonas lipolytica]QIZ77047.1 DUF3192 domain-containing protein [Ferrimonas lipolytica]